MFASRFQMLSSSCLKFDCFALFGAMASRQTPTPAEATAAAVAAAQSQVPPATGPFDQDSADARADEQARRSARHAELVRAWRAVCEPEHEESALALSSLDVQSVCFVSDVCHDVLMDRLFHLPTDILSRMQPSGRRITRTLRSARWADATSSEDDAAQPPPS
ncbi:unnamed protein product [Symbiodinium natans]|uniref:Uncharacterized protein n=1 Tax=Symbiodinium natans TaxID=878477 RepID=A0A812T5C9_9DINO|nr:unnamed protein product [Symbiodinium natans]